MQIQRVDNGTNKIPLLRLNETCGSRYNTLPVFHFHDAQHLKMNNISWINIFEPNIPSVDPCQSALRRWRMYNLQSLHAVMAKSRDMRRHSSLPPPVGHRQLSGTHCHEY